MSETIVYSGEFAQLPDVWEIHTQRDDGSKHLILMPKSTLDFRAAEYGIDPTDVDTLLDIIIHERLIPTPEEEDADPKLKAKKLPRLLQVTNTTDAQKYHLQRIRTARVQYKVKGNKALDPIRDGHKPDRKLISESAQMVDMARWLSNYGDLPPMPAPAFKSINATPFVKTGITDRQVSPSIDSINSTTLTIGPRS